MESIFLLTLSQSALGEGVGDGTVASLVPHVHPKHVDCIGLQPNDHGLCDLPVNSDPRRVLHHPLTVPLTVPVRHLKGDITNIEDCLDDYNCLSDAQKCISVMSCSNKAVINELTRFVHDAFKQRLFPTST